MRRVGRWLRRLGLALASLVGLLGLALAALLSPPGERWLAGVIQQAVQGLLCEGCTLSRPGLRLDLAPGRLTLTDVVFRDAQGEALIAVGGLDADLDLWALTGGVARVTRLRVARVRVAMETDEGGWLNLVHLFGGPSEEPVDPDAPPWEGLPLDIEVRDLHLSDGMVWLWGPAAPGEVPAGFDARVLDLAASRVFLPAHDPGVPVEVDGLVLDGVLLAPGPLPLSLSGDGGWTGEGVVGAPLALRALGTRLEVRGGVRDLYGAGAFDLDVDLPAVDLSLVDDLFGAGLAGRYSGGLRAEGGFGDLSVSGALQGTHGTRGSLRLRPGTRVCLPGPSVSVDPCGALPGRTPSRPSPQVPSAPGAPLRWTVDASLDGFALEDVLPVVGGPLTLEGRLRARGHGVVWPDEVRVVEGSWSARDLDVFGFPIREVDVGVDLFRGVLTLAPLRVGAGGARLAGRGSLDLVGGALAVEAGGDLVPVWLADVGLEGVSGTGTLGLRLEGRVFDEGAPIDVSGSLAARDLRWLEAAIRETAAEVEVGIVDGIVQVQGQVALEGVEAWGAWMPRVDSEDLRVRVEEGATEVRLSASAPELFHDEGIWVAQPRFEVGVDVPAVGEIGVEVRGRIGEHRLWSLPGARGRLRFGMVGDVIGMDLHLDHDRGPLLHLEGLRVDLLDQRLDARHLRLSPKPVGARRPVMDWVTSRPVALRWGDEGLPLIDVGVLASAGGGLDFSGSLQTRGEVTLSGHLSELSLDLFDQIFPEAALGWAGRLDAALDLTGDASDPVGQLSLTVSGASIPELVDGVDGSARLGVGGDVLAVDVGLTHPIGGELLTAQGIVPVYADLADPGPRASGPVDLRVALAGGSLERLSAALPVLGPLPEGEASALLRVHGDLVDPDILLQGVGDLRVPGLGERGRVELDVLRQAGELTVRADLLEGLAPLLRLDGTARTRLGEVIAWALEGGPEPELSDVNLFVDGLNLNLDLMDVPSETWQGLAGLELGIDGPIAGEVKVRGAPMTPLIDASLRADWVIGEQELPMRLCLRRPAPEGAGQQVGQGAFRRGGLFQRSGIQRLKSLRGVDAVQVCEDRLAGHKDPQTYGLWWRIGEDGDPWLTARGRVPVAIDLREDLETWGTTAFDVNLDGSGVPLWVLAAADPEVRAEQGALQLRGRLEGTLFDPQPSIRVRVQDGRLAYRPLGIRLEDLTVGGRVRPAGEGADGLDAFGALDLEITTLSMSTRPLMPGLDTVLAGTGAGRRGSTLSGSAVVHLREWGLDGVEAKLDLKDAWLVATEDMRLRVEGGLDVRGRYPRLSVGGRLGVTRGFFGIDTSDLLASRSLNVDDRLLICRPGVTAERCGGESDPASPAALETEPSVSAGGPERGLYESLRVAVKLDLGRSVQAEVKVPVLDTLGSFGASLTRADIEARVGGAIDVGLRRGRLSLVGDVSLLSGRVGVLRSRFDLTPESRVSFLGEDYANPQMDIGGTMSVGGGRVDLKLGGTPAAPTLELSSDTFGSDAELFTILLTGQAPEELSSQEGLAAAEALGDLLLNSLLGGMALGNVSVEGNGTVRFGVPVGRDVFLESVFNPTPELNRNRIEVGAEWSVLPQVLLTGSYGDRRVDGAVVWERRFDGPGRARLARERGAAARQETTVLPRGPRSVSVDRRGAREPEDEEDDEPADRRPERRSAPAPEGAEEE